MYVKTLTAEEALAISDSYIDRHKTDQLQFVFERILDASYKGGTSSLYSHDSSFILDYIQNVLQANNYTVGREMNNLLISWDKKEISNGTTEVKSESSQSVEQQSNGTDQSGSNS